MLLTMVQHRPSLLQRLLHASLQIGFQAFSRTLRLHDRHVVDVLPNRIATVHAGLNDRKSRKMVVRSADNPATA